jgi:hypothetical protein
VARHVTVTHVGGAAATCHLGDSLYLVHGYTYLTPGRAKRVARHFTVTHRAVTPVTCHFTVTVGGGVAVTCHLGGESL